MREKLLIICTILCFAFTYTKAQNIQVLYDFGTHIYNKDMPINPRIRSTFEMFKPDPWGSTFLCLDLNFANEGIVMAYTEVSRQLRFWELPLAIHIEYNGGLSNVTSFEHAALGGATYTYLSKDFSKMFGISALYKYIHQGAIDHSFQITGVWDVKFCKELLTFSGFIDYWMEDKSYMIENHCPHIVLSQPQLWVNFNKIKGVHEKLNLSLGIEVDLSLNFYKSGFCVLPAIGAKWSFN